MRALRGLSGIAGILVAGCAAGGGSAPPAAPPAVEAEAGNLRTDAEPLLLLDDEEASVAAPAGDIADNRRCHVCHMNYIQEDLALVHARAKIGCADCHGDCDDHIADESWAYGGNGTPPGIMYPRDKINAFCAGCHSCEKASTQVCTDCHGKHRLAERKCKWK
ncbi:MAG: hypothetical protein JXP34_11970 [Planctomycetes bacterium]|nr:hypothetical protein [Planctomycetota bacterium]